MMRLSTKGRYGLIAMLDLSLNYGEQPVALKSIAERQGISEPYLEQLIANLRKSGLVKSIRGAQGGYVLAQPPDKITVGDVMRVLEGSLAPVECVMEGSSVKCNKEDHCVTRIIWEKIRDSIDQVVDSITLADMVNEYNRINGENSYMYYI